MDLHAGQAALPPVSSGITDLYTGQASFQVNHQDQDVPDNDRCVNVCVNVSVLCYDVVVWILCVWSCKKCKSAEL